MAGSLPGSTTGTGQTGAIASPSLSLQARNTFKSSFEKFERTVNRISVTDHREFSCSTIQDVRQAAREVEQQLAARQCLRNMRRIEPLLNGLEAYAKVVEVLCNGTPYVSWIWAPIKLMLKVWCWLFSSRLFLEELAFTPPLIIFFFKTEAAFCLYLTGDS